MNEADENGNRPLHVAALMMCYDAMEYLIQQGAKKDVTNDKGHTPFQTAQETIHTLEEDPTSGDDNDNKEDGIEKERQQKCLELLRI